MFFSPIQIDLALSLNLFLKSPLNIHIVEGQHMVNQTVQHAFLILSVLHYFLRKLLRWSNQSRIQRRQRRGWCRRHIREAAQTTSPVSLFGSWPIKVVHPFLALHEHPFLATALLLFSTWASFQWSTASSHRKITVSLYFVMIEHEQKAYPGR